MSEKIKLFYDIIKNISTNNITLNIFLIEIKKSPFYYSQSLSDINTFKNIFSTKYFYQLESRVNQFVNKHINNSKKELYNNIDNIIINFFNYIKKDLTNQKINNLIQDYIKEDVEVRESMLPKNIYDLINKINITNANEQIYSLIINHFQSKENYYKLKIKSWINAIIEKNIIDKESTNKAEIFTLSQLKNLNNIGRIFNIDKQLINEINNSIKDKFVWIAGKYIDSSMGYGQNHGQMLTNYLRARRGEQINEFEQNYISNSRQPEDLMIEVTEEENNLPNACGSFYFNNQICIIEGRYLIERDDNNYKKLIKELQQRFVHVFDLTILDKQLKQEAKKK